MIDLRILFRLAGCSAPRTSAAQSRGPGPQVICFCLCSFSQRVPYLLPLDPGSALSLVREAKRESIFLHSGITCDSGPGSARGIISAVLSTLCGPRLSGERFRRSGLIFEQVPGGAFVDTHQQAYFERFANHSIPVTLGEERDERS